MRFFSRSASLPLGVDIASEFVSIVCSESSSDGVRMREQGTIDVPPVDALQLDLKLAESIRKIVSGFSTAERRCVLAAPSAEVVTRTFRIPPRMNRSEAERAAALEADTLVDWPASERLVALDPIPERDEELLLSVARASTIERIVAIARAAGLKPIAVDLPVCAWKRAVPDADAVLDCTRDRAELLVFGTPVGVSHYFAPRLIDERVAAHVRAAFVDARRNGVADVQRLVILGSPFRYESLEALLHNDGYAIAPLTLGDVEAPSWTFAYGLSSWSVAPHGISRP